MTATLINDDGRAPVVAVRRADGVLLQAGRNVVVLSDNEWERPGEFHRR